LRAIIPCAVLFIVVQLIGAAIVMQLAKRINGDANQPAA
jgi:hypothetical protein